MKLSDAVIRIRIDMTLWDIIKYLMISRRQLRRGIISIEDQKSMTFRVGAR